MPKLYPEALLFCVVWVALAVAGWAYAGLRAGLALSVGLFLIVMPASAITLSKTGNFALERGVRWGILLAAALVLFLVAGRSG
ncbi:MAG: hypothetical protein QOI38_2748 [Sphingomonadales bacterium]|jgi:hypothetical protein|nr:hypothetical protein [Sphingomonadales bacterium]